MACLVVESERGKRLVPEGPDGNVTGVQSDEKIIGVDWDCQGQFNPTVFNPSINFRTCSNCGQLGVYEST